MRTKTRQPDFPWGTEDFRLVSDVTMDGDRVTRERAASEAARLAQDRLQPPLFQPIRGGGWLEPPR